MAKRSASMQLTYETWDEVEEQEEAGYFQTATEEELSQRVMKRAKRRGPASNDESSGAFSAFTGFATSSKTTPETFNFGFLTKPNNGIQNKSSLNSNGLGMNVTTKENKVILTGQQTQTSGPSTNSTKTSQRNPEFFRKLKALNEDVSEWISVHVKKNALCVLTPIFKDYEKYYSKLESEYPCAEGQLANKDSGDTETEPSLNVFTSSKKGTHDSPTDNVSSISTSTISAFSNTTSTPTTSSMFKDEPRFFLNQSNSFGGSANSSGFSFATSSSGSTSKTNEEEEEYVPPQPEINRVTEKDAFFQKRCKLFYKKQDNFVDKGVCMVYLKILNEKTQLIIRADVPQGTVLLNIFLDPSLNPQKTGTNNVLLSCIANPPINPKEPKEEVVTFLIRVKTEEDANELLKQINDHKS